MEHEDLFLAPAGQLGHEVTLPPPHPSAAINSSCLGSSVGDLWAAAEHELRLPDPTSLPSGASPPSALPSPPPPFVHSVPPPTFVAYKEFCGSAPGYVFKLVVAALDTGPIYVAVHYLRPWLGLTENQEATE